MTVVAVLTEGPDPLPALGLLDLQVENRPACLEGALATPADLLVVDAAADPLAARELCRLLDAAGLGPVLLAADEAVLAAIGPGWPCADLVLTSAGPAELGARLRRLLAAEPSRAPLAPGRVTLGELEVDEESWSARLRGRRLNLTFKEFELLRHLAGHPGRVFTREQLLDRVWGAEYVGGVRTVDVHVRRLRAKLGEAESLISTVRGVGYRAGLGPSMVE